MGFVEKEQSRARRKSVVSTLAGVGTEEQIEGQESIETLENGKYLPNQPAEPRSKGRPKENREIKKRISLAVFPSVYDDIGKIAYVDRDTISNLIGKCLEEYIKQNQDKIVEYDRLKK